MAASTHKTWTNNPLHAPHGCRYSDAPGSATDTRVAYTFPFLLSSVWQSRRRQQLPHLHSTLHQGAHLCQRRRGFSSHVAVCLRVSISGGFWCQGSSASLGIPRFWAKPKPLSSRCHPCHQRVACKCNCPTLREPPTVAVADGRIQAKSRRPPDGRFLL